MQQSWQLGPERGCLQSSTEIISRLNQKTEPTGSPVLHTHPKTPFSHRTAALHEHNKHALQQHITMNFHQGQIELKEHLPYSQHSEV